MRRRRRRRFDRMRRGDAAVIGDVGREALCFEISGGQQQVEAGVEARGFVKLFASKKMSWG